MAGAEDTGVKRIQRVGQVEMGLGMLGRRQVTPRWMNDPVWLHDQSRKESGQGWFRHPPRRKSGRGRKRVERVKKSRIAYVTINDGA